MRVVSRCLPALMLMFLLAQPTRAQVNNGDAVIAGPTAARQYKWRAAPLGTLPTGEQAAEERAVRRPRSYASLPAPTGRGARATLPKTVGRPENRWRYRYFEGRWWYWSPQNHWTFHDGRRWTSYRPTGEYRPVKVDPAQLRLEAKEGIYGRHRWPSVGGPGGASGAPQDGLGLSGTQGSLGGGLSGSFTNPAGVPSAINTTTGTTTDVSGLNGAGRFAPPGGLGAGQPATGMGARAPGR